MQIRAAVSPSELQEAARMSRGRSFWLRFFAANWYGTALLLLVVVVGANGAIHHQQMKWGAMLGFAAICVFFIGLSWYRWNSRLAKIAGASNARSGTLSLESDGIRMTSASGASTFVPWSSYNKWIEGKSVFLLTGNDGTAILPIDDGNRESVRGLLTSQIR